MRRCMLDDLVACARRLSIEPAGLRPDVARRLIHEAHTAHHYAKRYGRPHQKWGNGSLMTRALADGPFVPQALCLGSLAVIAAAVDQFRTQSATLRRGLS
jgi:hypothetical protein